MKILASTPTLVVLYSDKDLATLLTMTVPNRSDWEVQDTITSSTQYPLAVRVRVSSSEKTVVLTPVTLPQELLWPDF